MKNYKVSCIVAVVILLCLVIYNDVRAQSYSSINQGMCATSGSIGGGLLAVGATASGTVTVPSAAIGMHCEATATDGTNMIALGAIPTCTVTSANTVTVNVIAIITLTPSAKTYNVRVK